MKRFRQRKAFTVIEMVVVIAVIAILATVLVPTISGVIQKANHSADTQFAASLNVQLSLWQVEENRTIQSESDLRDAINWYYGDEGAVDFYATLNPKSAKQGYHYWWNVTDNLVVLEKYENLVDPVALAAVDEDAPTFSPASPRSLMIQTKEGKKNFFLMDREGSKLSDFLKELDSVEDAVKLQQVIGSIDALEEDAYLADLVVGKLNTIAVANQNGLFVSGTPSYLYIPQSATQLGASPVNNLSSIKEIYLPDSITKVVGSSLIGFATDNSRWDKPNATTLFVNTVEENLKNIFDANSTDCVIQLPDGNRYIINGTSIQKLTESGPVNVGTAEYSTKLSSFQISGPNEAGKAVYLLWNGNGGTIYYTPDHTGNVTLEAHTFKDEKNADSPRPVTWSAGTVDSQDSAKVTLSLEQLNNAATSGITVSSTDNVKYPIAVQAVALENLDAKFNNEAGNYSGDGNVVTERTYNDIEYTKDSSWEITTDVSIQNKVNYVAINEDVDIVIGGTGASNLELSGKTLKIKGNPTGAFSATVTVKTKAKDASGNTKSVTLNLNFKAPSAVFKIADNADTQTKYDITFTVGTSGAIELGTLFDVKQGNVSGNICVRIGTNNNEGDTQALTKNGSTDWKKWTIDIEDNRNGDYWISIADGSGDPQKLNVSIKKGAYNVASEAEWKAVPDNTSIVLLGDVTISTYLGDGMKTGTGNYSKSIGSSSIYGNLFKIVLPDFKIKSPSTGSNNYFIQMSTGSLENLIIQGPEYDKASGTYKDTTGYYVSGVQTTGNGSIVNSYISGFRQPVRSNGGTLTITNTTLMGGVVANLYTNTSNAVFSLNNVTMIQRPNTHGLLGMGIYVDSKATGVQINGSAELYTFISEDEAKKLSFGGTSVSNDVINAMMKLTNCIHKIGSTDYFHGGIFLRKDTDGSAGATCGLSGYTGKTEVTYKFLGFISSTQGWAYTLDSSKCGTCNHKLTPEWGSSADDYRESRLITE